MDTSSAQSDSPNGGPPPVPDHILEDVKRNSVIAKETSEPPSAANEEMQAPPTMPSPADTITEVGMEEDIEEAIVVPMEAPAMMSETPHGVQHIGNNETAMTQIVSKSATPQSGDNHIDNNNNNSSNNSQNDKNENISLSRRSSKLAIKSKIKHGGDASLQWHTKEATEKAKIESAKTQHFGNTAIKGVGDYENVYDPNMVTNDIIFRNNKQFIHISFKLILYFIYWLVFAIMGLIILSNANSILVLLETLYRYNVDCIINSYMIRVTKEIVTNGQILFIFGIGGSILSILILFLFGYKRFFWENRNFARFNYYFSQFFVYSIVITSFTWQFYVMFGGYSGESLYDEVDKRQTRLSRNICTSQTGVNMTVYDELMDYKPQIVDTPQGITFYVLFLFYGIFIPITILTMTFWPFERCCHFGKGKYVFSEYEMYQGWCLHDLCQKCCKYANQQRQARSPSATHM